MKKNLKTLALVVMLSLTGLLTAGVTLAANANNVTIPRLNFQPNYNSGAAATLVESIFNWFFVIAGILCIAIIIWAGITYATAGGDEEKVEKAKKRLIYGIIGVAVIIAAFAITQFIYSAISQGNIPAPEL